MVDSQASEALQRIIESARRLGVELDEEEALQWLTAVAASQGGDQITVDVGSGVFGHRVSMLDFSPQELERFRQIGKLVALPDKPGLVETALALSGSAAQSKIQTYPGDADYFQRVNIRAGSLEQARQILADLMHDKAMQTERGPSYQLIEVKFGNFPFAVQRGERSIPAGAPISWNAAEVRQKQFDVTLPDGTPAVITWEQAAQDPGWCKLDWVVADPEHGRLANASNMLDVTWESPDGSIVPLDGYLDGYFQEVYLDAGSIPIFAKLAKHVSPDALDDYVTQLEKEVNKYVTRDLNYGKAAKRMYNVFRLTGRYEEAAYLRELFDEPASMLYQVWSLIRTIDDCCDPTSAMNAEQMLSQTDQLILAVINALEGNEETEIVRRLLRLRDALTRQQTNEQLTAEAEAARAEVINIVNNFFYEKLTAIPAIKEYIEGLKPKPA